MIAMQVFTVAAAWVTLCGGVTQRSDAAGTLSVVKAARAEEDRRVVVKGYLVYGSHARQLWLSNRAFRRGKTRACLTLVETGPHHEMLSKNSNRDVLITGNIRRDVITGFVDYGACNKVGIAVQSVDVDN